ncbi:hypothetical protein [Porphyromonas sp.]
MRNCQLSVGSPSEDKLPYDAPRGELFMLHQPLNILETVSLEGEVEDFQDGEDF